MTPEERTTILDALVRLTKQDADLVDPLTTFLPLATHRYALRPDALVVLGGRGAGKTALFRLVNEPRTAARLRSFFEDDGIPDVTWIDAFSQASMRHPEVGTLEAHATGASDLSLRAFWMTHLLRRVLDEVPALVPVPVALEGVMHAPVADLAAWLPAAEANLGAVSATLDACERALVAADRSVVATYDNLDRIGQLEPGVRRRYTSTLLALWLSLANRYKKLRGKIFLRDDLFDAAELGFPDATKLRARAETILWDHAALYRVVVRHLATTSEAMRASLREVPGLELRDRGEFGWVPGEMPNEVQRNFVGWLAWRVIGKGVLKGATHEWIVNRLQDANGRVTPRAMLWFFGFAGEAAQKRPAGRRKTPLVSDDLVVALRQTSSQRVTEIKEEYPLAVRLENLRGMTIPLQREEAAKRLGTPRTGEPGGISARGDAILEELVRLGVLKSGEDGRLDVPDIYRYAFEIAPDYATAWADYLRDDNPSAREQLIRELPRLGEILRHSIDAQWWNLAEEEIERGDLESARAKCMRALDAARSGGERAGEAHVWVILGQLSDKQNNHDRACYEFRHAVDLAHRLGDVGLETEALWWLGNIEDGLGRGDVAVEWFRLALSIAQRNADLGLFEALSFRSLAIRAYEVGRTWQAFSLAAIAAVIAARKDQSGGALFTLTRDQMASQLRLTPEQVEALSQEAAQAYDRDHGWGALRDAFPDLIPPAS